MYLIHNEDSNSIDATFKTKRQAIWFSKKLTVMHPDKKIVIEKITNDFENRICGYAMSGVFLKRK